MKDAVVLSIIVVPRVGAGGAVLENAVVSVQRSVLETTVLDTVVFSVMVMLPVEVVGYLVDIGVLETGVLEPTVLGPADESMSRLNRGRS